MSNHVSIHSMIKSDDRGYLSCQLFAYASKSLPAIEIVGMGKRGKIIKEKIIYWLKKRNIKLPAKRFVICLETFVRLNLDAEESICWLELPALILLLVLGDMIVFKNTEWCFCAGYLGLDGNYFFPTRELPLESMLQHLSSENLIVISNPKQENIFTFNNYKQLDFEELIAYVRKP